MSWLVLPVAVVPTLHRVRLPRGALAQPSPVLPGLLPPTAPLPAVESTWTQTGQEAGLAGPAFPSGPAPGRPERAISSLRSQPLHCLPPVVCAWSVLPPVRGAQPPPDHGPLRVSVRVRVPPPAQVPRGPGGQPSLPSLGGPTGAVGSGPAGLSPKPPIWEHKQEGWWMRSARPPVLRLCLGPQFPHPRAYSLTPASWSR